MMTPHLPGTTEIKTALKIKTDPVFKALLETTNKIPTKCIPENIRIYSALLSAVLSAVKCIPWHQWLCVSISACREKGKFSFCRSWCKQMYRETPFLLPLSVYFHPSCSTSSVKHLFLISVRAGSCFRQALSSCAQKGITWFTLPEFLAAPNPLKLKLLPFLSGANCKMWQICAIGVSGRNPNLATTNWILSLHNSWYERKGM